MYILTMETTGPECSVAIADGQGNIKEKSSGDRLNHLSRLMPLTAELLQEEGIEPDSIDAVAASEGPGSFTGIRIGVSTARALAQVWGVPCVAVPTLYAFGRSVEDELAEGRVYACPVLDARRNQVYGACVGRHDECDGAGGGIVEKVPSGPYMLDEFLQLTAEMLVEECGGAENVKLIFLGDGVEKYGDQIEKWAEEKGADIELRAVYQHAESVCRVAMEMYERGETVEYGCFEPQYMRKAEAQRKLEERLAAEGEADG